MNIAANQNQSNPVFLFVLVIIMLLLISVIVELTEYRLGQQQTETSCRHYADMNDVIFSHMEDSCLVQVKPGRWITKEMHEKLRVINR